MVRADGWMGCRERRRSTDARGRGAGSSRSPPFQSGDRAREALAMAFDLASLAFIQVDQSCKDPSTGSLAYRARNRIAECWCRSRGRAGRPEVIRRLTSAGQAPVSAHHAVSRRKESDRDVLHPQPLGGHERHVRRTHRVRIAPQEKACLRGEYSAQVSLQNVVANEQRDLVCDLPVSSPRRRHHDQISSHELRPLAQVRMARRDRRQLVSRDQGSWSTHGQRSTLSSPF